MLENVTESAISIAIILFFGLFIYSKAKNITMTDAVKDIIEFFKEEKNNGGRFTSK